MLATRNRIYRRRDLNALGIDFTAKHLRTMEERGQFPRRFQLSERAVAYVADEVDNWLSRKIRAGRVGEATRG